MGENVGIELIGRPPPDGIASERSPRYIMTGREVDYTKHVREEFGGYVQTHEEHDSQMFDRTLGAICLGPTGNAQGTHNFMSLTTGALISRTRWTALPMPQEVIQRATHRGAAQHMPKTRTFPDRYAAEIDDHPADVSDDDSDDSSYVPDNHEASDDDISYATTTVYDNDDDDYPDGSVDNTGVNGSDNSDHVSDDASADTLENTGVEADKVEVETVTSEQDNDDDLDDDLDEQLDWTESFDGHEPNQDDEREDYSDDSDGDPEDNPPTESDRFQHAASIGAEAARTQGTSERARRKRKTTKRDPAFNYLQSAVSSIEPDVLLAMIEDDDPQKMFNYSTAQMSAKAG